MRRFLNPMPATDCTSDSQPDDGASEARNPQLAELVMITIKHNPGSPWRARYLPSDNYPLTPYLPTHIRTLHPTPHLWNIRP